MRQTLGERCARLICSKLCVPVEDFVDAGNRVTGNGSDLLSGAACIVQSCDAGVTQNPHGQPCGRNAQRVAAIVLDRVAGRKTLLPFAEFVTKLGKGAAKARKAPGAPADVVDEEGGRSNRSISLLRH